MPNLEVEYMGLKLKNPLIAASSGLTDSVEGIKRLEENGAAAVVLKSLFEEEILMEIEQNLKKMSRDSFLYPETVDFYEHEDHDDESTLKYLDLITEAKKAVDIPIIASINCVTADEWTYFPKRIQEAGADALELNIFILPTDFSRNAADNEKVYCDIIREVKKQVTIPISLKISPYFSSLGQMLQKLSGSGVDSLVMFNRFYNPDFDINRFEVTTSNVLSSPADIKTSLRWISIMANRVKCCITASTGVHDADAVVKQLLAGATAVQVASVLYKEGPAYLNVMLEGLKNWMDEHEYENLEQFRGKMSQSASDNTAAYERVQFLRYFRGYPKPL